MCRRTESIAAQNCAADKLTKACTRRRNYVELRADLLRDSSTLKHLPETREDFDGLLEQLAAGTGSQEETKQ